MHDEEVILDTLIEVGRPAYCGQQSLDPEEWERRRMWLSPDWWTQFDQFPRPSAASLALLFLLMAANPEV